MRRVVLEQLLVGFIGEDIVAVSTLDLSVFLFLFLRDIRLLLAYLFELLNSLVIDGLEIHDFAGIALLKDGPFKVILVNCLEVVGQVFVDFEARDGQEGH